MKYEVHITRTAERDITRAADYIEYVLYNQEAADYLLDEIENVVSSLTEFPEKYQTIDDPLLKAWGVRSVKVGSYLMFYVVCADQERVLIIRFLFSRRNWNSILKSDISFE